ncbi:type II toxin-antitoxin system RelE/ParE family toxin [Flavisphingomonas formosensis]|uniref:type II toxin-antitoxin system RelE/ParE family toxin n=1 Tax=Flavisphingomonas formosensis TaxID=861534 RepID=UPI0012FB8610|nr:type II toxin-antitoxin system RelE/ParE family toxin [Sphingomonas formosensis]
MIRSYRSKPLRLFAEKGDASKLPIQNVDRLRRMLAALDAAPIPEDMNLPGYHFHGLATDPKRWSCRVTGNWRLTFAWDDMDAIDVDLEDYH